MMTVGWGAMCALPVQQSTGVGRPTAVVKAAVTPPPAPAPEPPAMVPPQLMPPNCDIEPCLALTFDDGPYTGTTMQLVNTLDAHHARATFFMLGSQVIKHPEIARAVQAEGHEIGNHSWGHGNFTKMQPVQMIEDFTHAQKAFQDAGVTAPRLFRPPYGARNAIVLSAIPITFAYWNIDPKDWGVKDPAHLADVVVASAKPGGIMVLHDIKPQTIAAAASFVPRLQQHYRLVTVSELMNLAPDSPKSEIFGRQ